MGLFDLRLMGIGAIGTITAATLLGCGGGIRPGADDVVAPQPPERLRAQVLESLPHDQSAFTQGFEIAHGTMYESTGLVGLSTVRAVDMTTGKELARVVLAEPYFGEGITTTETSLWQLTWKNGIAYERDLSTLEEKRRVSYRGEGWGVCHQAGRERLVMSDGSDTLTFRDPQTFAETGRARIVSGGTPPTRLNELECVDDLVYANVWHSDTILRIDPDQRRVTGEIDASGLLTEKEREAGAGDLNGIAAVPGTDGFFLTGKYWPKTFRVRFVPR